MDTVNTHNRELFRRLLSAAGEGFLTQGEPMKNHTSFKVGGPADYFAVPESPQQIIRLMDICREENISCTVIGNGSNLLVSDSGVRGLVIEIGKAMGSISCEENIITAGAGALLKTVAVTARDRGLTGFEFASGIPGSVGGACVMNAGAYDGEMKQVLRSVKVIDGGKIREIPADDLELGYRTSSILKNKYVVTEAVIGLTEGNREEIALKMKELSERRREKQPLEYPSAGSTFKRPEGYFAGKLISDAGLKGLRRGGAMVSTKHAGFIINEGNACAKDIYELINEVSERVYDKFGVRLEREVKLLGEF